MRGRLACCSKKIVVCVLVAFLLGCFVLPGYAKAKYNWRFGSPWVGNTRNDAYQLFCDLVGVYSKGQIAVKFYPNSMLGGHDETFDAVQDGSTEMGAFTPYSTIVPGGFLTGMSWAVETYEQAALAYAPPGGVNGEDPGILYKVLNDAWEEVGCHLLWVGSMGLYGVANNVRPLTQPADFANWKFRVSGSKGSVMTFQNMAKGTGLTCVTIPWSDLYNALERKVVDGCWATRTHMIQDRLWEVNKFYTPLGWTWDTCNIVVNKELWDGLSDELKGAVMKAARVAEMANNEAHRREEMLADRQLTENGVQIYYPTAEERAAFREASDMPAIWDELGKAWLEKTYPGQDMTRTILTELDNIKKSLNQ